LNPTTASIIIVTTPIKIGERKNDSSAGVSADGISKDVVDTGMSRDVDGAGAGAVKDVLILLPVSMFLCTLHIKYISNLTELDMMAT